ncbi:uncharacterized protein LOC129614935 isoform X2 [Condylostylus longicornis]|uniref:uncharacterized protein LOC129614935 isoform X2 n=1 Tax=Condylostylus longicornis TaxID=2530218 RepID=UPI00244DEDC4|nr:uncharacterized protein LOC129614935 isoform X2 [Condylostylus longicornis]
MSDLDESAGQHQAIGIGVTPRSSLGSGIYSSGSSISPSTSSSSSQGSAKTAVSDCLGAWLNYLQVLNNLCAAGFRLAQSISSLEQWGHPPSAETYVLSQGPSNFNNPSSSQLSAHFTNAWEDLQRATAVATSTVKSHIVTVLQDFITTSMAPTTAQVTVEQEIEQQRVRDHNQQIVLENAQTMINIQHQFCAASYDSFSSLTCCFVCQVPLGFSHDPECTMIQQKHGINVEQRSQTPSPHFGGVIQPQQQTQLQKTEQFRLPSVPAVDSRNIIFGSSSTQASSEHVYGVGGLEQTRGPSPQEIRGPSPIQGFLENVRGPLPNPGHLIGMKSPFYRGSRSPLNFPLFPLTGQRRWSEAAAGEVRLHSVDVESQMRRWSMPWEASKSDKNTVTWHQTRVMPISKLAIPTTSKTSSERSQSTTPDSLFQPSVTSQDGLAEAIQLLSCRPQRNYSLQQQQSLPTQQLPSLGPPFIEEPAPYEIWSTENQDRLPSIKFPPRFKERDENPPQS